MSFGCSVQKQKVGGPAHGGNDHPKKEEAKPQIINLVAGSVMYTGAKGEQLFQIHFQSGQASLAVEDPKGDSSGAFHDVSGEIYQGAKQASTFLAKNGNGDQVSQILTLDRDVQVTSKDPSAVLTCDRMIYDGKRKLIKAIGNVRVTGTMSTEDAIKELWATPDLKKIATPDLFDQP